MPTFTNTIKARGLCGYSNTDVVDYAGAIAGTVPDNITNMPFLRLGFASLAGFWITVHHLMRLDLRRYIGLSATSVNFSVYQFLATKNLGGTLSDIELRSHSRTNRTGVFVDADHQTYSELAAETLYASHAGLLSTASGGVSSVISFSNNGVELLTAINAALDSDGILDFSICLESLRTNNPPSGTDTEHVTFYNSDYIDSSPDNDEPGFEITFEGEKNLYFPATTPDDLLVCSVSSSAWSDILNGTGATYEASPTKYYPIQCMDHSFTGTSYQHDEILFRFDLSGIDVGKGIQAAYFNMLVSGESETHVDTEPWHIRRYDWTGSASATHYRTQAQLTSYQKIAEFTSADIIANDGWPPEYPSSECQYDFIIDGGEELINVCLSAPSNAGFVIHSERMITGAAPPTLVPDRFKCTPVAEDLAMNSSFGIVVVYSDGSLFFGSVF